MNQILQKVIPLLVVSLLVLQSCTQNKHDVNEIEHTNQVDVETAASAKSSSDDTAKY